MKIFFVKAIVLLSMFLISVCTFAQVQIDSVIVTAETCSGNCDGTLTVLTSGGTGTEMFDIGGTPNTTSK